MILSVSRRTDIPAFYTPWFVRRLREGFVMVRNPMNPRQVSRIPLTPETVDCIVFWSKNPEPLLPYLPEIMRMGYQPLFQVTLNGYGSDVETNLPPLAARIDTIYRLSDAVGSERVIWRYDPMLLSDAYTVSWHAETFSGIAQALQGRVDRCVISFLDVYEKIRARLRAAKIRACTEPEMHALAAALSETAGRCRLPLQTCAEKIDLSRYGISHGACLDGEWISRVLGYPLKKGKDPNQRSECGCMPGVDIGVYNTCRNGCVYCYANHRPQSVERAMACHQPDSPLLTGILLPDDRITGRKLASLRDPSGQQLSLF